MKKLKIAVAFILFAALCLGIYVAQNEPNVHIPNIANEIKPESDKLPEQTEQKNETVNESTEPPEKNVLLYIERGSNRLYLVRPSDSIEKIALKTGVSSEELLRLNGSDAFFPYSIIEIP